MKEINGYLLVEVPEGDKDFKMNPYNNKVLYDNDNYDAPFPPTIHLPKGNYSIIGLGKDLTEEQWKGIVHYWERFDETGKSIAKKSGHSLLKANNLNPNTTLILKQVV